MFGIHSPLSKRWELELSEFWRQWRQTHVHHPGRVTRGSSPPGVALCPPNLLHLRNWQPTSWVLAQNPHWRTAKPSHFRPELNIKCEVAMTILSQVNLPILPFGCCPCRHFLAQETWTHERGSFVSSEDTLGIPWPSSRMVALLQQLRTLVKLLN